MSKFNRRKREANRQQSNEQLDRERAKKRLVVGRMYILPDGGLFLLGYGHGRTINRWSKHYWCGREQSSDGVIESSGKFDGELRQCEMVPKGQEPWWMINYEGKAFPRWHDRPHKIDAETHLGSKPTIRQWVAIDVHQAIVEQQGPTNDPLKQTAVGCFRRTLEMMNEQKITNAISQYLVAVRGCCTMFFLSVNYQPGKQPAIKHDFYTEWQDVPANRRKVCKTEYPPPNG